MTGDVGQSAPLPTTTGSAEPTSKSTGYGLRPARGGPYTKLSPGHHATIVCEAVGSLTLEVVSIDEYGVTGYVVSDEGGVETGAATMVPWPSIALLTWPVL